MRIIQNGHCLIVDHQMELLRPFSEKEVKEAMFKIDSNKSPGSDGFGSGFYKAAWLIIGDDITKVIMDFFQNGRHYNRKSTSPRCLMKIDLKKAYDMDKEAYSKMTLLHHFCSYL
ncbi:hypothetical protein KY285_023182 [Solanum tuberosum]|nr:hypothetical protein KY285_023182 [Solanum tuberosum]